MDAILSGDFFSKALFPILVCLCCIVIAGNERLGCLLRMFTGIIGFSIPVFLLGKSLCVSGSNPLCSFYFSILDFYNGKLAGYIEIGVVLLVWLNVITAFIAIARGAKNHDPGLTIAGAICGLVALASHPVVSTPSITSFGVDILSLAFGVDKLIERAAAKTF